MIDIAGAAETLPLLSTNLNLTSMGIVPQNSAILSTQNMMTHGAFALIAPWVQQWWPTRDEVQLYVFEEIEKAFLAHDTQVRHSQPQYSMPQTTVIMPGSGPLEVPKFIELTKIGRPVPVPLSATDAADLDIGSFEIDGVGAFQMEPILAWATDISLPYLI